ncbi:helix-turn-helix domain-containing protein [Timonella senegalensis]|uniref:helix-turn-helix domain-containing protein n=1 Tax=Timonella senegalensis TaxID=1465825 RepID=UPI0028A8AB5A|nr:helix-turn-helix domain-containing protein [Timonella senegalensis]
MNNLNEWIAQQVLNALDNEKRSKRWLSDITGIPYSTLNRKMSAHVEFRFSELLAIAEALHLSPEKFLPQGFTAQAHAAA